MSKRATTAVIAVVALMVALCGALAAILPVTPARADPSPQVQPASGATTLRGVFCRSTTDCVAVGLGTGGGVILPVTDGIPGAPATVPGSTFYGVSCPDPVTCVAVGTAPGNLGAVVVITNGVPGPVQTTATTGLFAVACPSPALCVAVGSVGGSGGGAVVPIAAGVAGPVQVVPGTEGGGLGLLGGIDCATSSTCLAGGRNGSTQAVVVAVTNGTAATAVVVPDSGEVHAVSCRTASICEAVSDAGITPVTDGTPGPTRGGVSAIYLRGVSCPSDTACALVGIGSNQVIPALSPFGFPPGHSEQVVGAGTLWAIACPAVGRCLAVGDGSAGGVVATFLPPTVTTSPQDRTVVAGNPVSFDAASDGVPTPIVQWQVSTDGGTTFSDIPGAMSAAYGFIATAADQGRRYRAVFKNVTGITPSNAATLTVQVPTTTGLVSSLSPSVSGEAVTFTATVNPSPSAGTIQFSVDNAAAGAPVAVNAGHAAFNLSTLAVGTHTVGASYSGGDNFLGSQGSTGQVVNKAATAVTVGSSAAPSVSGQEVTFTATVAPVAPGGGMPTGTVQFSVAGTPSGDPVPVGAGRASFATTALDVGKNTVAAAYSGDDRFLTSHGSLDQTVNKAATAATLVSSAAAPPTVGEAVTFTATIAAVGPGAGVPTGTVQFSVDGAKAGGPVPVSSGRAALTTTSLTAGKHTVAALYSGAPNFLASQGSLDQTVNADNPVTIAGPPRDPAGLPVAPVTPPAPAPNPAPKGTLPLTGGNPLPLALTAVALTLAGGALRKRTRS